jgi:hypothetical protein
MSTPTNATYSDLLIAPQTNSAIYVGATTNSQPSSLNINKESLKLFDSDGNVTQITNNGIFSNSSTIFDISTNLTFAGTGNTSMSSGYVLTSNGAGVCPTFQPVPFPNISMTLDQTLTNGNVTSKSLIIEDPSGNYTNINSANISFQNGSFKSIVSASTINMSIDDGITYSMVNVTPNQFDLYSSQTSYSDPAASIISFTPSSIVASKHLDISATSLTIGGHAGSLGQVLVSTGSGLPIWRYVPFGNRYYTPTGTNGIVNYSSFGFVNPPVVVATAVANDGVVISISISSVTNTGCNWTTSTLAIRVNFLFYTTD